MTKKIIHTCNCGFEGDEELYMLHQCNESREPTQDEFDMMQPLDLSQIDRASGTDCSIISFQLNATTLSEDPEVAKYNFLADQLMKAVFEGLVFKDNFEVERLVGAFQEASRSHGSAAMLRLGRTKH